MHAADPVIGTRVRGIDDRPVGSRHPKHADLIYPINYRYVEGVLGGDGEEQDVYLLGTARWNGSKGPSSPSTIGWTTSKINGSFLWTGRTIRMTTFWIPSVFRNSFTPVI